MEPQAQARRGGTANPSASRRREQRLVALATRQHGVVARRQLIALGFKSGAIKRRIEAGRLHRLHRGVYALGYPRLDRQGRWLAAVLAYGTGAVLSHRSAAALWGLLGNRSPGVDVTALHGRSGRRGIVFHECQLGAEDMTTRSAIPVTTVARTLFDLAEVVDSAQLRHVFEEADRLGLLETNALQRVVDQGWGRHALKPVRPLIAEARHPDTTRSSLEDRFVAFCRERELPAPVTNVLVLGFEVDALWIHERLIVELDGFAYHRHRAAFERDRARDTALQAAGYRVLRITHRRLEDDPTRVAAQLRRLLSY